MGVIAGFVILSYYAVVAGWAMDYTLKSMANFAAPIHTQAEIEATQYIANASIDEMREELAQQRADRRVKPIVSAIESEAEPSIWKEAWPRFELP